MSPARCCNRVYAGGGVRGHGPVPGKLREYIGPMLSMLPHGFSRLAPSVCAVCGAWPAAAVCEHCVQSFAQPAHRCANCAIQLPNGMIRCRACAKSPPPWDRALAVVDYAYPWDRLIAEFKFREDAAWARAFAGLMRNSPWVEPALDEADVLIPMPLAPERLRQRGFNQTALLARQLCPHKTLLHSLLRVVHTAPQSSMPRKDRQGNVQNAFALDPFRLDTVNGKRVVLIDDVMTSGASLSAAARALKRAGAIHVTALVFARTGGGSATA